MKKAIKIVGISTSIITALMGILGLIYLILALVNGAGTSVVGSMIILDLQIIAAVLLIIAVAKSKPIFTLVTAISALMLLILDMFVFGGAFLTGGLFASSMAQMTDLFTVAKIIGYLQIAMLASVIILQAIAILVKPKRIAA